MLWMRKRKIRTKEELVMKDMKWEIRYRSGEPGDEFIDAVVTRSGVQQVFRANVYIGRSGRKDVRGHLANSLEELSRILKLSHEDGGPLIGYASYDGVQTLVQELPDVY
jgi:hypothetical protein